MKHYSEDDLTLYYYGEGRRRDDVERHLSRCAACAATYRDIAGTLAMIETPQAPERSDTYGLEVWQRIRHQLPERELGFNWLPRFAVFAAAAAVASLSGAASASRRIVASRSVSDP